MSKHWKSLKNIASNVHGRTGGKHEECRGTFKKLVRNSKYSKSENFKKLSVLAQILRKYVYIHV